MLTPRRLLEAFFSAALAVAGQPRLTLLGSVRQPQGPLATELHCIIAYYSGRQVAFSAVKQRKLSCLLPFSFLICVRACICYPLWCLAVLKL